MHAREARTVLSSIAVPYSLTDSTFKKREGFNSNIDLASCASCGGGGGPGDQLWVGSLADGCSPNCKL